MSGITPLIDSLLHQVLGKRVDTPAAKDVNAPVKPIDPGRGPNALHSDSRLDARSTAGQTAPLTRHSGLPGQPLASPGGESAAPSSQTRLSASAERIADLLLRYPAPEQTLRSSRPLLSTPFTPLAAGTAAASTAAGAGADAGTTTSAASASATGVPLATAATLRSSASSAAAARLAQHLEGTIRDSGLFYEAHLGRWMKGEIGREQLAREPQMWLTLRFTPLARAPGGPPGALHGSGAVGTASGMATTSGGAPWRATLPAGFVPQGSPLTAGPLGATTTAILGANAAADGAPGTGSDPRPPGTASGPHALSQNSVSQASLAHPAASMATAEALSESLAPLVRHQLELLAAPLLRWEGDVWSGLFMALLIQPLQRDERGGGHPHGHDDGNAAPDDEPGWRSELSLDVAGLGRLDVVAMMGDTRLSLTLAARDTVVRERLDGQLDSLRKRLEGHGFHSVVLSVVERHDEEPS
ncbi:flagellar hook-length control protein FliK [Halomonas sp. V046]|uniref:flagellar hook-length control protein FliK n=1 Tax=Halomonas sp. V046 TaxID=3459611 RepID=UPI004044E2D3